MRQILLILGCLTFIYADILHIKPYAQWTFDTPMESVIYRSNTQGFPIKYILTAHKISYYDSLGNRLREINRTPGDVFRINDHQSAFMLVQVQPSNDIENPQRLYSFQVYDYRGDPIYTVVHGSDLGAGELNYKLTDYMSLMLTEQGEPWVLEISDEDTLLYIESCLSQTHENCKTNVIAAQMATRNELVTAASCMEPHKEDSLFLELRLWNQDVVQGNPIKVPGRLESVESLSGTDYYFLEVFNGYSSSLTLYNRENALGLYPWKSWVIEPLGRDAAFVISESDLNVINLGDGSIVTSYHPIDMSTISDALYLQYWGLFLYIRYDPFFTEAGQQAYRNFELEGVNKTGRIAHRSSFGSWSLSLPKISQIGKDLFAIHIHNAVLLYRIELERE